MQYTAYILSFYRKQSNAVSLQESIFTKLYHFNVAVFNPTYIAVGDLDFTPIS